MISDVESFQLATTELNLVRVSIGPIGPVDSLDSDSSEFDLQERTREETIRLVQRVFFSGTTAPQVVVFSGVEHGSGCSWVCARTAQILSAHVEGLVCLVDANFRSPCLHRHFDVENPGEVSDEALLSGPVRRLEQPLVASNLWLLSDRSTNAAWQAPLNLDRLRSQVSKLRKNFTYILIDAPPLNTCADAPLLGRIADGLIMILEANSTRRETAIRAKESLNAAGVRLLGAVLNKRTYPIPDRVYRKL